MNCISNDPMNNFDKIPHNCIEISKQKCLEHVMKCKLFYSTVSSNATHGKYIFVVTDNDFFYTIRKSSNFLNYTHNAMGFYHSLTFPFVKISVRLGYLNTLIIYFVYYLKSFSLILDKGFSRKVN